MKNRILKTALGMSAVLLMTAVTSVAASYRVTVDCNHSSMRNTQTGNRITVSFLDANRNVIRRVWRNGIRGCAITDATFSMTTNRVVRYVEFSTNGNDAFYIDEWRLYRNGRLILHQGRDNGRGWCLSTDSRDAAGAWAAYVTGGCRSRIRFPVSGVTIPPPMNLNYRVAVDCGHTGMSNTQTGNRITVSFLDGARNVIRRVWRNGVGSCGIADTTFSITSNRDVRYVEFRTNGNDAFYIDEWRLYRNGRMIARRGSDNGRGWCLSTDSRDATGPWAGFVTGGCRTRIRFPVAGVGGPPPMNTNYRVAVDCGHTAMSNTQTGNRITVSFLDANRNVIRRVWRNGVGSCGTADTTFSMTTNRVVRYIEFSTNGNDAFYIDEWRLYRNGAMIRHVGRDNGRGWCLSTDPRDATGPWAGFVTGGCRGRIRF